VLLGVFANALAADVDVPGQAARGLAPDHPVQRIVFILGDGDAHLDGPVVLGDVRGDLGLRVPTEPRVARGGAVEIDHGAGGTDGDLVIGARVGFQQDLDAIAVP